MSFSLFQSLSRLISLFFYSVFLSLFYWSLMFLLQFLQIIFFLFPLLCFLSLSICLLSHSLFVISLTKSQGNDCELSLQSWKDTKLLPSTVDVKQSLRQRFKHLWMDALAAVQEVPGSNLLQRKRQMRSLINDRISCRSETDLKLVTSTTRG